MQKYLNIDIVQIFYVCVAHVHVQTNVLVLVLTQFRTQAAEVGSLFLSCYHVSSGEQNQVTNFVNHRLWNTLLKPAGHTGQGSR